MAQAQAKEIEQLSPFLRSVECILASKGKENHHSVCSFGGIDGTDKIIKEYGGICLGSMAYDGKWKKMKTMWHLHRPKIKEDIAVAWLKAILDPETSPWRDLIRAQTPQSLEFVYDNGFILDNLNFPANYVVNFLTAFRLTQEYPEKARLWYELTQEGASFGAAVATIGFVNAYNVGTKTAVLVPSVCHYAFTWPSKDWDYFKRINDASPVKERFLQNFNKSTAYLPCNVIWSDLKIGYPNFYDENPIYRKLVKFCQAHAKKADAPVKKRMFEDPQELRGNNVKPVKFEDVLAWCKGVDSGEINGT